MTKANVTTDQAAKCLGILKKAAAPIVAADLAAKLGLSGSRESQRRHVREIVKHLRDNGSWIVATLKGGYWLTMDEKLWRDYQEGRQIEAKRIIGSAHKEKKMLTDSQGQGLLFERRVRCGVASMGVT